MLDVLFAFKWTEMNATIRENPQRVVTEMVSGNYYTALGVKPPYIGWAAVRSNLFYSQTTETRLSLCVSRNTRTSGKFESTAGQTLAWRLSSRKNRKA